MIRQEKLNVNTTVELITQNNYDRQQNHNTRNPAKENEIEQEPIQRIQTRQNGEYSITKPKKNIYGISTHKNE